MALLPARPVPTKSGRRNNVLPSSRSERFSFFRASRPHTSRRYHRRIGLRCHWRGRNDGRSSKRSGRAHLCPGGRVCLCSHRSSTSRPTLVPSGAGVSVTLAERGCPRTNDLSHDPSSSHLHRKTRPVRFFSPQSWGSEKPRNRNTMGKHCGAGPNTRFGAPAEAPGLHHLAGHYQITSGVQQGIRIREKSR